VRARVLPLVAGAAMAALGLAFVVLGLVLPGHNNGSAAVEFATCTWFLVGALIVTLKPGNPVGWLFSLSGLMWASEFAFGDIAERAGPGSLLTFASWWAAWAWIVAILAPITCLYIFPTGRPISRVWRRTLVVAVSLGTVGVVATMIDPELQATSAAPTVTNPIGVAGLAGLQTGASAVLYRLVLLGAALAGVAAFVSRYRSSGGVERQQLKWVAFGGPIAVFGWIAAGALDSLGIHGDLPWIVPFIAIPVSAGIAILRHQLFDIDRLISKTLVYGSLTVLLGAGYVGLVLTGQALFSSFTGGSNLAIAVSTLLVAALFLPVRARVQGFVDRRFYRRRYDAQRTLEGFGARLREQVDLETLDAELRAAIDATMQPAHVSLWRRVEARR
jgi:hypothetical protein